MKNYIIISEEGEVYQSTSITDDDKMACDDGILSIINPERLEEYSNGEWIELPYWNI